MNVGQLRKEVERTAHKPQVKIKGLNTLNSELFTPEEIIDAVLEM
jgi:hypothetical protein